MEKHVVKKLIPEEELNARIKEVAAQINRDYEGKNLHLIGILKGSVPALCEIAKNLTVPVTMDFMSCSSYGGDTTSKGVVRLIKDLDEPIEGKDVMVVEDIIDSGHTLHYLRKILLDRHPASLKICTLLDKPSRRVRNDVPVDYSCFQIPDAFVVGFGLDYDQCYRNLPYIGYVEFTD